MSDAHWQFLAALVIVGGTAAVVAIQRQPAAIVRHVTVVDTVHVAVPTVRPVTSTTCAMGLVPATVVRQKRSLAWFDFVLVPSGDTFEVTVTGWPIGSTFCFDMKDRR